MDELLGASEFTKRSFRRDLAATGTYQEFVSLLYEDLDCCINGLQSIANAVQKDGEDRLTFDLILPLRQLGYRATHDAMSGGHVDITVHHGAHSWIAEAKLDWEIDEGLKQLTTRYIAASGDPSHDHGGLIFYLKREDANAIMLGWRAKMEAMGHQCSDCLQSRLAFYSEIKLKGTGLPYVVRSMAVSLFWEPQDESGKKTRARRAAKKASTGA
jgi:hypothetical protein